MTSTTVDSARIAQKPDADANTTSNYPDSGLWPILKGVEEGWIILPKNPTMPLPPLEEGVAIISDMTIEEALIEVRGA